MSKTSTRRRGTGYASGWDGVFGKCGHEWVSAGIMYTSYPGQLGMKCAKCGKTGKRRDGETTVKED